MIYIVMRYDKPNADSYRIEEKPAHREFLKSLGSRLLSAGAIFDTENQVIGGSIMFEAENFEEANAIAMEDPYARHPGIARSTEVLPFRMRWKDGVFYGEEGFSPTASMRIS